MLPVVVEILTGPAEAERRYQPQMPAALIVSITDESGFGSMSMAVPNTVDKRFHTNSCLQYVRTSACIALRCVACNGPQPARSTAITADSCYEQMANRPAQLVQGNGQASVFSFDLARLSEASGSDRSNIRWRIEVFGIDKNRTIIYRKSLPLQKPSIRNYSLTSAICTLQGC
jgi:hypothetical protein